MTGLGWLMAAVMLAGAGSDARGATADGTLITNTVSATFGAPGGVGFQVSYCATRTVKVANPCVSLQKVSTPTAVAAGGTMTYTLWVVNCSATSSAFNVNVSDRLPDNVAMDALRGNWTGPAGGTWTPWRGSDGSTWEAGAPGAGQTTPYFLRFALDMLGPSRSAMQQYSVTVL